MEVRICYNVLEWSMIRETAATRDCGELIRQGSYTHTMRKAKQFVTSRPINT